MFSCSVSARVFVAESLDPTGRNLEVLGENQYREVLVLYQTYTREASAAPAASFKSASQP